MKLTSSRTLHVIGIGVIVILWIVLAIRLSAANPTIGISDMFGFIPRAESLSLSDSAPWVHGFYPFGYPLMLRSVFLIVGDYEMAGRVIALVSAILTILMVIRTALILFDYKVALVSVAFVASNPIFIRYATMSGTDMPAVSLLMVFLSYAVSFSRTYHNRDLLISALALGLAYLVRYTSLTLLPAMFTWLLLADRPSPVKIRLANVLLFAAVFVIAALPQFVLSAIVQGNPLWNLQARNVFFGMYGAGNWGHNMPAAREIESLAEVIGQAPVLFLRHWYYTAIGVFRLDLVQYPLWLIAGAGMLLSLKHPVQRLSTLLVMGCVTAYVLAVSMAFVNNRLLLFCTPILLIYAAYAGCRLIPSRLPLVVIHKYRIKSLILMTFALWLLWFHMRPVWQKPLSEYDERRILVSAVFNAMLDSPKPEEVLAFSFDYYDLGSPTKDRYSIDWYDTSFVPYASVGDIAERMRAANQRFLVFDRHAPRNVRGLDDLWPFDPNMTTNYFETVEIPTDAVTIYQLK
mgnify:FL=1